MNKEKNMSTSLAGAAAKSAGSLKQGMTNVTEKVRERKNPKQL